MYLVCLFQFILLSYQKGNTKNNDTLPYIPKNHEALKVAMISKQVVLSTALPQRFLLEWKVFGDGAKLASARDFQMINATREKVLHFTIVPTLCEDHVKKQSNGYVRWSLGCRSLSQALAGIYLGPPPNS